MQEVINKTLSVIMLIQFLLVICLLVPSAASTDLIYHNIYINIYILCGPNDVLQDPL